jgi:hypothetical protein
MGNWCNRDEEKCIFLEAFYELSQVEMGFCKKWQGFNFIHENGQNQPSRQWLGFMGGRGSGFGHGLP